jgi:hypothetical protein
MIAVSHTRIAMQRGRLFALVLCSLSLWSAPLLAGAPTPEASPAPDASARYDDACSKAVLSLLDQIDFKKAAPPEFEGWVSLCNEHPNDQICKMAVELSMRNFGRSPFSCKPGAVQ